MTLPAIMAAIDTRLATIAFPTAHIAFLNITYRPIAGMAYLRASTASLVLTPLTMGADAASGIGGAGYTAQWDGVLQVDAVWPENTGADGCYQMQQLLLRLFYRGLTLVTSDSLVVTFNAPTALPLRPDSAWVRGPVRCPWWCLETS